MATKPKAKPAKGKAKSAKPKTKPASKTSKATTKRPKAKPKAKPKANASAKAKPKAKPKAQPQRKPQKTQNPQPANRLTEAVDHMQDLAPGTLAHIRRPPDSHGRTPWLIVVKFSLPSGSTYDDVFEILRDWRDDRPIERLIGAQRLSRIQANFTTDRGRQGQYTLAEIGPWSLVISRAVERVAIRDNRRDSLIARYGTSANKQDSPSSISSLYVWFSSNNAQRITM
jgi:hypothetical protein